MNRPTRWLAAALLAVSAGAARAQEMPGDVPAGPATLRGRIVHATRADAALNVPVILYALAADGVPGLRSATADAGGRFAFEGLANDPSTVYLLGARFGDVPFGKRVAFEEGQIERAVEIEVSDPTDDPSALSPREIDLRLERGCAELHVRETHHVENQGERVVFVPEDARADAAPLLELTLPAGASAIESSMGAFADGFERDGDVLRFWGPLYPGPQEVAFVYGLALPPEPARRLALRLGLPGGASEVNVLTRPGGARVTGPALEAFPEVELDGRPYERLRAPAVAPGGALSLEVELAEPGASHSGVEIAHSRLWLELDDAALSVNEQHRIDVTETAHGAAAGDAPLLCIALPADAEGLRFAPEALGWGLEPEPSGALAIRGPLPPGPSVLALRYRLPSDSEPFLFERRFDEPVDLLSVLVADTGILPETSRLHRRRPVRSADRNYVHLEGFAIEAGESIALRLERIAPGRPLPRSAAAGFALLVAAAALVFLLGPLRGRGEADEAEESVAAEERESVYSALRDLEEDFETGKLDAADHERMRAELRARAVALLRAEREQADSERAPQAGERPASCPACGAEVRTDDRFCSQCGAKLLPEVSGDPAG